MDKKTIIVGSHRAPQVAYTSEQIVSHPYRSSKAERRSKMQIKQGMSPMHGRMNSVVHIPQPDGSIKPMTLKNAIKKGFIKVSTKSDIK